MLNINRLAILRNIYLHNSFRLLSCWSCGKESNSLISKLFCSHCKVLQNPNDKDNYFKIMGLEESYDVDDTRLSKTYKDLQKHLHPDKFANRKKEELEISENYSSLVNEAYKTLLEPLARGIYMLNLRGHQISEDTEVDNEFLMKIMEINEEVAEADTEEEILKLNKENKIIINELQKQLSKAFFDEDLKLITKLLRQMKYYTSIDNQIQTVIRNKGIIR